MKRKCCKVAVIGFVLTVLLSGCDYEREELPSNIGIVDSTDTVSSSSTSEESSSSTSSSSTSSSSSSSSSSIESSTEPDSSSVEETSKVDPIPSDVMYLNGSFYGREEPYYDATRTKVYELNEAVRIVDVTDTGFYKLDNGDYVAIDCIDPEPTYYEVRLKKSVPTEPPKETGTPVEYDRKAALDYAKENWNKGESLCAGFATECLTAGGLDFNYSSSTRLFNLLVDSGLGYAVIFDLNDDRTAYAPDFAYPGDLVFLYCRNENQMVHTAVYNGSTKDGIIKAYAHNPADNGEKDFKYYKNCVSPCGYELDQMAMFCFYRGEDEKTLESAPAIKAEFTKNGGVRLSWQADFLYSDSELIIYNSAEDEIYRIQMGTDLSELVKIDVPGEYSAVVKMKISNGITVQSSAEFTIEDKTAVSGETLDTAV